MKINNIFFKLWLCIFSLISYTSFAEDEKPLKFTPSFHYFQDLSDTYMGGSLINVEFDVKRNWYGMSACYGHFQSQYTFIHQVIVEEANNYKINIPIEEMAIMKSIAISFIITPIKSNRFSVDLQSGICFNTSRWLMIKDVYYSYDLKEEKFTSLTKDYQLIKRNHLGYQVGIDLSFFFTKKAGFEISSRIQSLHNGGSFFFVGGGFCFNL
jgi:hypothetical protein